MFKKDPANSEAIASLSPGQRLAFVTSGIGAIFPIFFLAAVRPVYWLVALQFLCLAVFAYIRWRALAFKGSLLVVILAALACVVSIVAALAA
jgi:hypothetical protein